MKETNKKTNLKKRKVAVFDIDGTIFRSSLLIELVDVLIERELFPEKARNIFDTKRILWLERKGNYDSYIMAVVEVFMKYIKGIHYKDVLEASKEVFRRKKDHTYVYTRSAVAKLKKQGYFLLAVSLSPKTIVDPFGNIIIADYLNHKIRMLSANCKFIFIFIFYQKITLKIQIHK